MYYENKKEKKFKGTAIFIAMLVIIGLLFALNLRLEGMQNSRYSNFKRIFCR